MDFPAGWPLYHEYEEEITTKNRFFLNPKFERLFLRIIKNESNIYALLPQKSLFRARANKLGEDFKHVSELRGNKNAPSANRASPVGIPYTYLAEDAKTAIAEIRANVGQKITVAEFRINSKKDILTLDRDSSCGGSIKDEFSSLEIASFIVYLSHAFARPIKEGENRELTYLPCQYFAEFCKKHNFSGIRYLSAARSGNVNKNYYNYVIFNDDDLIFMEANLYTVARIKYKTESNGKAYLIDDSKKCYFKE